MGTQVFRSSRTDEYFNRYAPAEWRRDGWHPRRDAAESIYIERALMAIEAQPYNTLVPPLKSRKFVPTDNSVGPGAKFTAYRQYTRNGVARLITESGVDLPIVGAFVKEFVHQFYAVGAAYEYSYFDLLAIGFAMSKGESVNLDLELSIAAREAIEKKLDLIAAWGSASAGAWALEVEEDVGLVGLINLTNASTYTIPNGAGGTTAWSTKTPDEILADLNGIVSYQVSTTYEVHTPDEIIVPTAQYQSQLQRSMGDGRAETIASYFVRTRKEIGESVMLSSWPYLDGAGAGSTDRMIAHKRDPRMARHVISMEATPLPQQQEGLNIRIPVVAKTAGVIAPYPLSVTYADGI